MRTRSIAIENIAGRRVLFSGLAILLLIPWGVVQGQVVSLTGYDNIAAWAASGESLTDGMGLVFVEDFNFSPPGTLNPGSNQFGPMNIELNVQPFNTSINVGVGHPAYHVDGSPALRGILFDPSEEIVFTFAEPVIGFAFTIQRPDTPVEFPVLLVDVEGTPAPPVSVLAPPDGFYGILDTGGGSFQSFALSTSGSPQSFIIDNIHFLVPDIELPDDPITRFWTSTSGGIFGIGSNWNSGVPPDANDTAAFDLAEETFSVAFSVDVENDQLQLHNGHVTFDLGGNTYELTSPAATTGGVTSNSINVGVLNGDDAALTIANGTLSGVVSVIGHRSGSEGIVTVSPGALWTQWSDLFVGLEGSGTLVVEEGGSVIAETIFASSSSLHGEGTITVNGAVLDGVELVFDDVQNTSKTISFGEGGELNLNITNSGDIGAGHQGTGTITITDGVLLDTNVGYLGYATGSHGTATITGEGTTWDNWSTFVGYFGTGELTIENGGTIIGDFAGGLIGYEVGAQGTATVTGEGSTWTATNYFQIGRRGTGELIVEQGGTISSSSGFIGGTDFFTTATGVGTVTVTDSGSSWTNSGELTVGYLGDGTLTVENGGAVSNTDGYLGRGNHANSSGTVTVTGNGSTWTNSGNLILSGSALNTSTTGDSQLVVSDGGTVEIGGTLRIHGNGTVNLQSGGTILTQHFDPTDGTFNFTGGTLAITGEFAGDLHVPQAGTLKGDGTVVGNVMNAGLVAPGFSPEIIHVDGDYEQTAEGTLEIEIGGLTPGTQHDQLQVTGTATLNGRLQVSLIDGFVPVANDEIIALQAGNISGTFSSIAPPVLDPMGNIAVQYIYNDTDMRIRFVGVGDTIQFVRDTAGTTNWADPLNWSGGTVPGSPNVVELQNLAAAGVQRLEVKEDVMLPDSANAYVHRVSVEGTANDDMTLAVFSNLSVTTELTAAKRGIIELNGGNVAAANVNVEGGGVLNGEGNVFAKLTIGGGSGEAMLSPGLSGSGHLAVLNDYEQHANGVLVLNIDGNDPGELDTLAVSGALELGGKLQIDAASLEMPVAGTTYEIITAGTLSEGEIFDVVETIGNEDVFFAPIYNVSGIGSGTFGGSGSNTTGRVAVGVYNNGDMNRNGFYDPEDVEAFALALTRPFDYFSSFFIFGSESGDLNHDGRIDFDDIQDFSNLISGTGATMGDIMSAIERAQQPVPEPGAWVIISCMSAIIFLCRSP